MRQFIQKHYILSSLLGALALEAAALPVLWLVNGGPELLGLSPGEALAALPFSLLLAVLIALFFCYPQVLTAAQFLLLLRRPDRSLERQERVFDALTLSLGCLYTPLYLSLTRDVVFGADWTATLSNSETHTPIATWHLPAVLALLLAGLAGYLVLNYVPLKKLPPLLCVVCLAGMYLACGAGILWSVQVITPPLMESWRLGLLPLNLLVITARTVRRKGAEWRALDRRAGRYSSSLLNACDRILCQSKLWPLLAFLLMWPLLGVLTGLLVLFGQAPDGAIRAWTETSDWNLSRRVAPQNVYYDEHYLCTVAAGGHRKLVKPLRLGVRHGHQVIVNRQLCVANAFEQILEERTPRFHRAVRGFYDKYGFPVARLIRSSYAADAVYLLMKPLEWLFLAVLYLTDARPEDRIAVQYTGKSLKDFPDTGGRHR